MIKLKGLIKINEQGEVPTSPQPPAAPGAAPTPEPTVPDASAQSPEPPVAGTGEYDFTKDFKEFEDTSNKAKTDAKKKFLDKLNGSVVGKKVTTNASRGYGQPQKDYTIDSVAKGSVDWYYSKNVVVLTDNNGKEYFLTPGVNIKIDASVAAPEAGQPDQEQPDAEVPKAAPSAPEPQEPSGSPTPEPGASAPGNEAPSGPAAVPEPPTAKVAAAKIPVPPQNPEEPEEEKPLKEYTQNSRIVKDIKDSLSEFFVNEDIRLNKYVKSSKTKVNKDSLNVISEYKMEIPHGLFKQQIDLREMKLNLVNGLRNRFQPSENIIEIESVGKNYLFTIIKEIV